VGRRGRVADYDADALKELLSDVTDPDNDDTRRRVREVDTIRPANHGIEVTLTVEIPTRTKGTITWGDSP